MIATAQYNLVLQMRHDLHLDSAMKEKVDGLSLAIEKTLLENNAATFEEDLFLSSMFSLRMDAIKYVSQMPDFSYSHEADLAEIDLEVLSLDQRFCVLADNILAFLRLSKKIMGGLDSTGGDNIVKQEFSPISYGQLKSLIPYEDVITLLNSSLKIEAALISLDMIHKEDVSVSDDCIAQLERLTGKAVQKMAASMRRMGLMKISGKALEVTEDVVFPESYIREQKALADVGIEEWAKTLR